MVRFIKAGATNSALQTVLFTTRRAAAIHLDLLRDRSANFSIMTALLMLPLTILAGGLVDFSYAATERQNLQSLTDAAALAAARHFDGTNSRDVSDFAIAFARQVKPQVDCDVTIDTSRREITVISNLRHSTFFLGIIGMNHIAVGASAAAVSPIKPAKISLTATAARGHFYKLVTVRVTRPGSDKEVVVARVTYQPTLHDGQGKGDLTVEPAGRIDLGDYEKLSLQQDLKYDGCGVGYEAHYRGSDAGYHVTCIVNSQLPYQKFDSTLRTDNRETSHHLFVDGKQLSKGAEDPLSDVIPCGQSSEHAWEDGGNWEKQDFFYKIAAECSTQGARVRLVK